MTDAPTSRIRILSNPGVWRDGDNPFLKLLLSSYGPGVVVIPFSWRRAITGRYDILHLHWLEYLVRSERAPAQLVKRALFAVLLLRLALLRTPSMWTVHNDSPHEGDSSRIEAALLRWWSRAVTHRVFLTASARSTAGNPPSSSVILHGHYRPVLEGQPERREPKPTAKLLHFGHIRPYKGIETLIDTFEDAWPDVGTRPALKVVGRAKDPSYGAMLAQRVAGVGGMHLDLVFLSDARLEQEIRDHDLVVLPYTRMNNSGAALLALSIGRPILVPSSPSMRELRDEVGDQWVHLFEAPLSPVALAQAADAAARSQEGEPDLSRRDWQPIGLAYSDLFHGLAHGRTG